MRILILISAVLTAFSTLLLASTPSEPLHVSMVSLIANPDRYDKSFIQTEGYLEYGSKRPILYLSRETEREGVLDDAIQLYPGKTKVDFSGCANRWVIVVGTFDAKNKGNWQAHAASMYDIQSVQSHD